jgi:RNA 3'-terminal phosphate cyclase (ATP)
MGANIAIGLDRYGFYPAGGGKLICEIKARETELNPFDLQERGKLRTVDALILGSQVPSSIIEREKTTIKNMLSGLLDVQTRNIENSAGPGNYLHVRIVHDTITQVFSALGEHGRSAESVATEAINATRHYLNSLASVDEHTADQLLLIYAAIGNGRFTCTNVSEHTRTNIEVIKFFLDIDVSLSQDEKNKVSVHISKK